MFRKNKKVQPIEGPLTAEALRKWLTEYLADRLGTDPADIDTGKSFEAYGLDSRTAVQASGALEKIVERRLSPALLYDHQTVDDLCSYLAGELRIPDRA
jgi:acyl carrier protein